MNEYKTELKRNETARELAADAVTEQLREIGMWAVEQSPEELPAEAAPLMQRYQGLSDEIARITGDISRMEEIDRRQEEIKQRMRELQKERDNLFRGLEPVYEQIGAVAFRLFREHPMVDSRYSLVFEDLARYQDQIREIEVRLRRSSGENGQTGSNVLSRVGTMGRTILLKGRRSVRESRLPGMLRSAGQQLAEGDFLEVVDDNELSRVSQPLRDARSGAHGIDEELQALTGESGALLEEFNRISRGNRLNRARQDQETEVRSAREKTNGVLVEIGGLLEEKKHGKPEDQMKRLKERRRKIVALEDLRIRLEAGLAVEEKEALLKACRREQQSVTAEIQVLQQRLEKLQGDDAQLVTEKEEMEKKRGSVEDLFAQTR